MLTKLLHKNYELSLDLYYECLSAEGETFIEQVTYPIHIETLIAMGLELQRDLYEELMSKLDTQYENNPNAIAVTDYYCNLGYATPPSITYGHLLLSNASSSNGGYVQVHSSMFIPEFRVLL